MLFCPKCGTILRPKEKLGKKILWCSCGFTTEIENKEKQEEEKIEKIENRGIEIAEEMETHPKVKNECGKCGHNEAYFWTQQTRAADEAETRFFKCAKCKHIWREYD